MSTFRRGICGGEGVVIMDDFLEVMMIIMVKGDPEDT